MPNITSFDILDSEIQKISGRPIVLEAFFALVGVEAKVFVPPPTNNNNDYASLYFN